MYFIINEKVKGLVSLGSNLGMGISILMYAFSSWYYLRLAKKRTSYLMYELNPE